MVHLNSIIIEGYLVQSPLLSYIGNNKIPLCKLRIASLGKDNTLLIDIQIFGEKALYSHLSFKSGYRIVVAGVLKYFESETMIKEEDKLLIEAKSINLLEKSETTI